ncbi:HK97 gp10 family phage protein [Stenotrophomonas lactitubi]|jgi:HK97 gp10 family phage protein|uniref:HK97-gp10 family putative phage morphogenesis protein n=1 Tax=Stenotrophomonas TaxID=40323 RepID=UPI002248ED22|nr:HK97-gp10 family putative phage morphogenesis protein [Stenotrophomonas lactitubi]MCX2892132.1 HK97 gp10 family phage protein [Stenotrophomonas lactitubi]
MAEQIEIHGLDGLLSSLKALPVELQGKPLQTALRRGGNLIRDAARARVPRASGFLATQIVVRRANARNRNRAGVGPGGEYFTVGVKTGKRAKYANTKRNRRQRRVGKVYVQAGWASYWRYLEFGTKKMAAKPFLTPAAEANGPQAAQLIVDQTRAAIDRVMKARGWK